MIVKNATINVGYQCNNYCTFCFDSYKRSIADKPASKIFQQIINARFRGFSRLQLIGGEITIRTDVIDIIKFAVTSGFKSVSITTNGRMFAYRDFAQKIIDAGITDIAFSIYGHTDNLHDSVTRVKGSFKESLTGIKNLRESGFINISFNTVILKQNYQHLLDIGRLLYQLGIINGTFIFIDSNLLTTHYDFYKFVPMISEVTPYVHNCFDMISDKVCNWRVVYLPLCYMLGYEKHFSELCEADSHQIQDPLLIYKNYSIDSHRTTGRIKASKCINCSYFDICAGIHVEYYRRYGDGELLPVNNIIKKKDIKEILFKFYKFY